MVFRCLATVIYSDHGLKTLPFDDLTGLNYLHIEIVRNSFAMYLVRYFMIWSKKK